MTASISNLCWIHLKLKTVLLSVTCGDVCILYFPLDFRHTPTHPWKWGNFCFRKCFPRFWTFHAKSRNVPGKAGQLVPFFTSKKIKAQREKSDLPTAHSSGVKFKPWQDHPSTSCLLHNFASAGAQSSWALPPHPYSTYMTIKSLVKFYLMYNHPYKIHNNC